MIQIIREIWSVLMEIPGCLRATIFSCIILLIFILLIKLLWKISLKIYGYLIVPIISISLYKLIINNKTEKLLQIDDWYYKKLEKLEFKITHNEIYSMSKLYKVIRNISCIIVSLFIILVIYDDSIEQKNNSFSLPHKITMFYYEIEEKLSQKLDLPIPIQDTYQSESTISDTNINKVNEDERTDIKDNLNVNAESKKIYFILNDSGYLGANVRDNPNKASDILAVVSGNILLEYMNEKEMDSDKRVWYYIKTPDDIVGWISSSLIEESLND